MSRDYILHKVRTALGRSAGQPPEEIPDARLTIPEVDMETRVESLFCAVEKLSGKTFRAAGAAEARDYVARLVADKSAVASNSPFLRECGITEITGVRSGIFDRQELKEACEHAAVGITSCEYALADTGSLVMLSSRTEARMVSLLPPTHVALVPKRVILTGLDELLTLMPHPLQRTSSMVLITGPSRTADIEQILVRGVHGPGEIHIVVVE